MRRAAYGNDCGEWHNTIGSRGPLGTLRAFVASVALRTCGPLSAGLALNALRSLFTSRAGRTLRTLYTVFTRIAIIAFRTSGSLNALRTGSYSVLRVLDREGY